MHRGNQIQRNRSIEQRHIVICQIVLRIIKPYTDTEKGIPREIESQRVQRAFKNSMIHEFCNSQYVSQFAVFFIDVGAESSTATHCRLVLYKRLDQGNQELNYLLKEVTIQGVNHRTDSTSVHYKTHW